MEGFARKGGKNDTSDLTTHASALYIKTLVSQKGTNVPRKFDHSVRNAFSAYNEMLSSSGGAPRLPLADPRAAMRSAPKRKGPQNVPPATSPRRPAVAVSRPKTVTLEGIADGKMLGDCSLSYAMGQLMVELQRGGQAAGGMYAVDPLPFGEWFVLADPRGFLLPVAIQRTRMDAYCVRMDLQPLQGLRALPAQPGWVPSPHASPGPATPQQQRQNDQMAVHALQAGLNASHQAAMNTANHLRF